MRCNIWTTSTIACQQPVKPGSAPICTLDDTANEYVSCTASFPSSVDSLIGKFHSTGLWVTGRWARNNAAFKAYVERTMLVQSKNRLPLPIYDEQAKAYAEVAKRPVATIVDGKFNP